jgi:dienelactone hydrolase
MSLDKFPVTHLTDSIKTPPQIKKQEHPISWTGHSWTWIRENLNPKDRLLQALAYCLFPFAAHCVINTSSSKFKRNCNETRLQESRRILQNLGGEEISLQMPDGHRVSAMYFSAENCIKNLLDKGGIKDVIQQSDGKKQEVIWIPHDNPEFSELIEKMKIPVYENSGNSYFRLGIPNENNNLNQTKSENSAVIYAPGSGHLFEFRRKTIGTFLIGFGTNMLVLNYSETGRSGGKITEQATYDNLEAAYKYLLNEKGASDSKIFGYGHCVGGGPTLHLASKHPINLLVDRTFLNMGEFATLRVNLELRIPKYFHFLTSWIIPVMNQCFGYDNIKKIERVKGKVAVLGVTKDEIIPPTYIHKLFDKAHQAKQKIKLILDGNHDEDLPIDDSTRLALGSFLIN